MTESETSLDIVFEKALEDLDDDAFRNKGKLDRSHVDKLYARRGISADQAVAIEKALQTEGVVIIEETAESIPSLESAGAGLRSTALDYLVSVAKRYPFLDAREEVECGEAIQAAFELRDKESFQHDALAERVFARAEAAKSKLITRNIRLVVKTAFEWQFRNRLDVDDLVQIGLIGLMRASDKFDPNWGTRFSTYAAWWIRQAMQRGIADQGSTIRIPAYMQESITKYRRVRRTLKFGDTYNGTQIKSIAESLAWTEEYTAKVAEFAEQRLVSLDAPIGSNGETKVGDVLSDDRPTPAEAYMQTERAKRVIRIVEQLGDERLIDIIKRRFGFGGSSETLQEIGDDYGITRERIRQLESLALQKLRHPTRLARLRDV